VFERVQGNSRIIAGAAGELLCRTIHGGGTTDLSDTGEGFLTKVILRGGSLMTEHTKDHVKFWTGIVLGIYAVLFAWGACENYKRHESRGVIALFAIPLLVQLVGLINLYFKPRQEADKVRTFFHLYWITMGLCAVFNCSLWVYYLYGGREGIVSYVAVLFILVLLSFVVVVTFAVLTRVSDDSAIPQTFLRKRAVEKLLDLREGIARMPFWALLHFLTIFLTVAFLFGFAFAFHDKSADVGQNSGLPPLYMARLPNNEKSQPTAREGGANPLPCSNFYFSEHHEAGLDTLDRDSVKGAETAINKRWVSKDKEKEVKMSMTNQAAMEQVTKQIMEISGNGHLAHVLLIGHADNRRVREGPYPNNYVLSQVRVDTIRNEVSKELLSKNNKKWCNVEWSYLPLSNDKYPEGRNYMENICTNSIKNDRVVQVYVNSVYGGPSEEILRRLGGDNFKPLSLMDYMYFAIYTITTTGYGDIMPTTNYAKALTCFANICEMFFIIGLFNALVALKDERRRNGGSSRDDANQPPSPQPKQAAG
jgi:hypothetical protein